MFLLNLKRFLKSPVFLLGTLGYIIVLYSMIPVHVATGIEDVSNSTLTTQAFSFFYFMMISYEFFYQIKSRQLEEIVQMSRMGLVREKLYGILIFVGMDLILTIVFLVASMIGTTSVIKTVNLDWLKMLAKAYLIYHFLTYLFAILLGMLTAMIRSRIRGFFMLVLSYSLFSKILYPIIIQCVNRSERWTHIVDILGIMNRNYSMFCDLIYNYTTEYVNLQRILFWIMLTVSISALVINRKRYKWVTGTAFVLTGIVWLFYIQPSGERYVYGDWGAYMDDQHYYGLQYYREDTSADGSEGIGRRYKDSDYKIMKYEGELAPGRVLKASIDVFVDRPDLEEYCFTLYHGYVLKNVTDDRGETLVFDQDIDHVLVKTNTSHNIKKIHFDYEGYSRKYVATSQAVFLAGNFPYLPNSGWNEYMKEPVGNAWNLAYNLKGAMYAIDYDLHIDTKQTVFSNLAKADTGHYVGKSKGATFVASPFVKKMELKNCIVYYPILAAQYRNENIETAKREYEDSVDEIEGMRGGTAEPLIVFALDGVMDTDISWYVADDHVIASSDALQELYAYYKESGCTIDHTKWDAEESEISEELEWQGEEE